MSQNIIIFSDVIKTSNVDNSYYEINGFYTQQYIAFKIENNLLDYEKNGYWITLSNKPYHEDSNFWFFQTTKKRFVKYLIEYQNFTGQCKQGDQDIKFMLLSRENVEKIKTQMLVDAGYVNKPNLTYQELRNIYSFHFL